jgi:hypothetical protein
MKGNNAMPQQNHRPGVVVLVGQLAIGLQTERERSKLEDKRDERRETMKI